MTTERLRYCEFFFRIVERAVLRGEGGGDAVLWVEINVNGFSWLRAAGRRGGEGRGGCCKAVLRGERRDAVR